MSYILDALKKSEAERQQGTTPGVGTIQAKQSFQRKRRTIWPYVAAIALILNVGSVVAALWFWGHGDHTAPHSADLAGQAALRTEEKSPPDPSAKTEASLQPPPVQTVNHPGIPTDAGEGAVPLPSPAPPPTATPVATDPAAAVASRPAPPPRGEAVPPETSTFAVSPSNNAPDPGDKRTVSLRARPSARPADQPSPEASTASPAPGAKPQRTRQPVEAKTDPPAAMRPPASEKTQGQPTFSGLQRKLPLNEGTPYPRKQRGDEASKPREDQPGDIHDLPPTVRNEVPRLSVSFLVYSDQPEERMVTINGKRMREGEEVSEGLKLERITPEGVVLNWRGKQFHKGIF